MRTCGYISIDRSDLESAIQSLQQAAETIRDGVSVLIFPEGTRSMDGEVGCFKKGGFVLAVQSGIPILPIIIDGTLGILPKGSGFVRRGRVNMEILEPIKTEDYSMDNKEELMDKIRVVLVENLDRLRKETNSW
jgi:1-acyl-sn-glycerol-3-phosphate acyltransferase